jgi:hypothetical protein
MAPLATGSCYVRLKYIFSCSQDRKKTAKAIAAEEEDEQLDESDVEYLEEHKQKKRKKSPAKRESIWTIPNDMVLCG